MLKFSVKNGPATLLAVIAEGLLFILSLSISSASAHDTDRFKTGADGIYEHSSHKHEHQSMQPHKTRYRKVIEDYHVPDIVLRNQDGIEVSLPDLMGTDKPLFMNFIFTSCTTLCPVMTATFAKLQKSLKSGGDDAHFVSISIDPDYDTPERLKQYAAKYGVTDGWEFLTGDIESIKRVQRAFHAFRGNKMNHAALTFMRISSNKDQWIRIDGSSSAGQLLREYRKYN